MGAIVTVVGNLGRDVDLRKSDDKPPMALFSVAQQVYNRETKENEAMWFSCIAFGRDAETIARFFRKGSRITVVGEVALPYVDQNTMKVSQNMSVMKWYFGGRNEESTMTDGEVETSFDPFDA